MFIDGGVSGVNVLAVKINSQMIGQIKSMRGLLTILAMNLIDKIHAKQSLQRRNLLPANALLDPLIPLPIISHRYHFSLNKHIYNKHKSFFGILFIVESICWVDFC
jgi:hypothetical protein